MWSIKKEILNTLQLMILITIIIIFNVVMIEIEDESKLFHNNNNNMIISWRMIIVTTSIGIVTVTINYYDYDNYNLYHKNYLIIEISIINSYNYTNISICKYCSWDITYNISICKCYLYTKIMLEVSTITRDLFAKMQFHPSPFWLHLFKRFE